MMTEMIIIVVMSKSMREQIKLVRFTQQISPSSPTLTQSSNQGRKHHGHHPASHSSLQNSQRGCSVMSWQSHEIKKTCIRRRQARNSLKVKHITLREDKDRWRTGCWVERWLMTFVCNAAELFGAASVWRHYPNTCGAHGTGENRDCRFLIIFCVPDIPPFISFTQQTLVFLLLL